MRRWTVFRLVAWRASAFFALVAALAGAPAAVAETTTAWAAAPQSQVRLIAGGGGGVPLVAGVDVQLEAGWKTYWRSPGDAGGVPPYFDWSASTNVASTEVLYPAPKRYTDRAGDTVGYKEHVTFPVRVALTDASKPASLRVKLEFGICREICIPAELQLALDVAAGGAGAMPQAISAALAKVPGEPRPGSPTVKSTLVVIDGDKPRISIEAVFPGGGEHGDVFVEAEGGAYVPLPPLPASGEGETRRFEIDLKGGGVDIGELKGKLLTATLVGEHGQSVVRFKAE